MGAEARKGGWKTPMTIEAGQRLVHDSQVEGGRVILDIWTPGSVAGCSRQPHVLNFVVDPFTGAPGRGGPTFDANGDGYFDSADNSKGSIVSFSNSGSRANIRLPGEGGLASPGPYRAARWQATVVQRC